MNVTASAGSRRAPARKKALAAFTISFARRSSRTSALELLHARALNGHQAIVPAAGVGFGLTDPQPQRLAVDAEITGDVRDRPARLKHQPHTAFSKLLG